MKQKISLKLAKEFQIITSVIYLLKILTLILKNLVLLLINQYK